ncbi:Ester hydrolase C11orf54-like protein [Formica fusca]
MQNASTSSSTSNLSLDLKYSSTSIQLHQPNEIELVHVLENGLKKNFEDVTVHWKICPDLSQEPYNLAAKGKKFANNF